jgi:hypothetical protein
MNIVKDLRIILVFAFESVVGAKNEWG